MVGRRAERLDTARRLGADHVIDAASTDDVVAAVQDATDGQRGADCVVEAVGSSDSWTAALGMVRPGGVINLFGGCPDGTTIPLDARRMHYEEISIRPTFHHTPATTRRALERTRAGGPAGAGPIRLPLRRCLYGRTTVVWWPAP